MHQTHIRYTYFRYYENLLKDSSWEIAGLKIIGKCPWWGTNLKNVNVCKYFPGNFMTIYQIVFLWSTYMRGCFECNPRFLWE